MKERVEGRLVLIGGPAGAGKSTSARAWCRSRERSVHLELDEVRSLIVSGLADPQVPNDVQAAQYRLAVEATISLARVFLAHGYDVAIDDALEPAAFEAYWIPCLDGIRYELVILLPDLDVALERSRHRTKRVLEERTRSQHAASLGWPGSIRIDTSKLEPAEVAGAITALVEG